MLGTFVVAIAIAGLVYVVAAPNHRLGMALRATARWSFLWFCLATCGSALNTLFGDELRNLGARGRELGLAFASAHTVHIVLVVWLLYRLTKPFPRFYLIVFSVGVFWVYLLAFLSLSSLSRDRLGPQRWKLLRSVGVEYIAFAFAFDFGGRILDGNRENALLYLPLFAAAISGPLLRLSASIKRRSQARRSPSMHD